VSEVVGFFFFIIYLTYECIAQSQRHSTKVMMQQMLERMLALQEKINAEMNANHKEMMAKIEAETEAIRTETKAMRDKRMEANRDYREKMTSCHEETETDSDPGMMQSIEEYQEIPKGEDAGRRTEEAA
jgi:hypothetical protein